MSKWEETLLDRQAMLGCSLIGKYCFSDVEDIIKETCIHQAEISFKAGYEKRDSEFVYNPDYLDFQKGVEAGRELGRREVVEWGNGRCEHSPKVFTRRHRCFKCWQAKLKELGLDEN